MRSRIALAKARRRFPTASDGKREGECMAVVKYQVSVLAEFSHAT